MSATLVGWSSQTAVGATSRTVPMSGASWTTTGSAAPAVYDTVLILAAVYGDATALTISDSTWVAVQPPTGGLGTTLVGAGTPTATVTGTLRWKMWRKTMTAGDLSSSPIVSMTRSGGSTSVFSVVAVAVRGSNSTLIGIGSFFGSPLGSNNANDTTATNTVTSVAWNAFAANSLILSFNMAGSGGGTGRLQFDAPTGMTERADVEGITTGAGGPVVQLASLASSVAQGASHTAKTAAIKDNTGTARTARWANVMIEVVPNATPTVSAGSDKSVATNTSVQLDGTAADTFGSIASSAWTQTSGPTCTIAEIPGGYNANVTAGTTPGTAVFRLTVVDNDGATAFDEVSVTVTNTPPIVSAGSNTTSVVGATLTLTGALAFDPEGGAVTLAWTQQSGPSASFVSGDTTLTPSIAVGAVAGTQVFRLTASDALGATSFDDVSVVVAGSTALPAPIAGVLDLPNDTVSVLLRYRVFNTPAGGDTHTLRRVLLAPGTVTEFSRGGLVGSTSFELQRSTDGGITYTTVRDAVELSPGVGLDVQAHDYELPAATDALFRARAIATDPVRVASDWSEPAPGVLTHRHWWVSDVVGNDGLVLQVPRAPVARSRGRDIGEMQAFGRSLSVVTLGDVRGSRWSLTIQFWSEAEFVKFEALTQLGRPVLLRYPVGPNRAHWVVFGQVEDALTPTSDIDTYPYRTVTVPAIEVAAPT